VGEHALGELGVAVELDAQQLEPSLIAGVASEEHRRPGVTEEDGRM